MSVKVSFDQDINLAQLGLGVVIGSYAATRKINKWARDKLQMEPGDNLFEYVTRARHTYDAKTKAQQSQMADVNTWAKFFATQGAPEAEAGTDKASTETPATGENIARGYL